MKQPLNIGNIYSKKSLGQNFIIDENFLKKLDKVIKTNSGTIIVEIVPGKGALTKYLSKKKLKQQSSKRLLRTTGGWTGTLPRTPR